MVNTEVSMTAPPHPHIVIIGAGFGGLFAARTLAGEALDVLLIDHAAAVPGGDGGP